VPKFIPDANGNPGERNTLQAIGLEHKMGIHGSPTCTMEYDGAKAGSWAKSSRAWPACSS
jgi:alkylation response protein AidB-like acyl-CoA dehydrogenase